jgi:UDP-2,3-diacylglucosamine pyrophosphatase LpxH
MKKNILLSVTLIVFLLASCTETKEQDPFHFYVVTDVHMTKSKPDYTNWFFRDNILTDIKKDSAGTGSFVVVTGDMDPFVNVKESVEQELGKDYRFYPVLGNHDVGYTNNKFELFPDANWGNTFDIVENNRNNLKKIVNYGPVYPTPALSNLSYHDSINGKTYFSTYDKGDVTGSEYTTYSFDEGNSHFVVLDIYSGLEYFSERHSGRIFNELYNWLEKDLSETDKENIFVFAHQPVWETGGEDKLSLVNLAYKDFCIRNARSMGADSLAWFKKNYTSKVRSKEDFWNLLSKNNVVAYFCGHVHHYSAKKFDGVWEINLEFGAWEIEGRSRYGEIFVDKNKVELLVKGYIEKTDSFKVIDRVALKN